MWCLYLYRHTDIRTNTDSLPASGLMATRHPSLPLMVGVGTMAVLSARLSVAAVKQPEPRTSQRATRDSPRGNRHGGDAPSSQVRGSIRMGQVYTPLLWSSRDSMHLLCKDCEQLQPAQHSDDWKYVLLTTSSSATLRDVRTTPGPR